MKISTPQVVAPTRRGAAGSASTVGGRAASVRGKPVFTWGMAALTAALGVTTLMGLSRPAALDSVSPDACAEAAAALLASPAPSPADLRRANALTEQEIALAPNRPAAWARAAYIASLGSSGFGPAAAADLRRSYALAPLDPDLALWRSAFAFRQWPVMPADLRARAAAEAGAFGRIHENAPAMRKVADGLPDPSGRFALSLLIEPQA